MDSAKERQVYRIFEEIAGGYDRANDRISLGLQRRWKRLLVDRLAAETPQGGAVLDVCCGTGDIALETARQRADIEVTGIDFSPGMLKVAERRGAGVPNLGFRRASALGLPFPAGGFSAAAISFGLRNTADYGRVLAEMRRVVKPGGLILCLDSVVPQNCLIQPFYRLYFGHLMPLLGGGRENAKLYRWLYDSTEQFLRLDGLEALFRAAGLREVGSQTRMLGACALVWGRA